MLFLNLFLCSSIPRAGTFADPQILFWCVRCVRNLVYASSGVLPRDGLVLPDSDVLRNEQHQRNERECGGSKMTPSGLLAQLDGDAAAEVSEHLSHWFPLAFERQPERLQAA